MNKPTARRVVGDTPEHGKHLLYDSHTDTITECNGGLAFAIGVAVMEAELARDDHRFWQVQHPNGVAIYHVHHVFIANQTIVIKIGA